MAIILDILVEHLEEIEFLWSQRTEAIRSPEYFGHEIRELDARIDAHLQGLLVGGEHCVEFAVPLLAEEDRFMAFAGAWCLARLGLDQPLLDQLDECDLDGVTEALCHCKIDTIEGKLNELYSSAPPSVASAIGLVLASHRRSPPVSRLSEFFEHDDPQVRRRAWETVSRSCCN
ncbi:MAG: hypothetical protein F9B45_31195 [Phycisphaera sp. RhM]|nr:hypothetical protein [Phycisphaera sp. RhM]